MYTKSVVTKAILNDLSYQIVGCAIEVHRALGPGLLESVYQKCMAQEMKLKGIYFESQLYVPIAYKGIELETDYRLDFLVEHAIVVELKAIDGLMPIHEAQLLTYMNLLGMAKGILINFNCEQIIKNGSRQMVNQLYRELPET